MHYPPQIMKGYSLAYPAMSLSFSLSFFLTYITSNQPVTTVSHKTYILTGEVAKQKKLYDGLLLSIFIENRNLE